MKCIWKLCERDNITVWNQKWDQRERKMRMMEQSPTLMIEWISLHVHIQDHFLHHWCWQCSISLFANQKQRNCSGVASLPFRKQPRNGSIARTQVFSDASTWAWAWLYLLTCNLTQWSLESLPTLSADGHISRKPRQKVTSKQNCGTFAEQVSLTGTMEMEHSVSTSTNCEERTFFNVSLSNCAALF